MKRKTKLKRPKAPENIVVKGFVQPQIPIGAIYLIMKGKRKRNPNAPKPPENIECEI